MTDSYHDAERRVLAALVLDWHRNADRLLGTEELKQHFNLTIDSKTFDAIVADLDRRDLVLAVYDKEGAAATLKPAGYKEAYNLVAHEIGNPGTFTVDWKKEEVVTEAEAPDWFPIPEGWKWLELAPVVPKRPLEPKPSNPVRAPINWEMWGVVVTIIGILVAIGLAAL